MKELLFLQLMQDWILLDLILLLVQNVSCYVLFSYKKGTDTFLDVLINHILLNFSCNEFQVSFSVPLNSAFRGRWFDDPANKLMLDHLY